MIQLSGNAIKVLERRYLAKNRSEEVIESPEQMFERVARTVAGAEYNDSTEEWADKFCRLMTNLEFLPNSPTLINAGRELGQLSACFVLPIEDSMESIFTTLRDAAIVQKSGGGVGFSFSDIRPMGDSVKSTQKCSGGPVAFIEIYDRALDVIKQGGVRHGANMAILRVDHPDIIDFIECKLFEGSIPNFNISVGVTDEFMSAVKADRKYQLINPRSGAITKEVKAKMIFNMIVRGTWESGEPGIIFLDEMNRCNMTPNAGEIKATNPCITGDSLISTTLGEIPIAELSNNGIVDVYTRNKDGNLGIKRARFFKTKCGARIIKIKTTKGEIRCTPDHKILTPNGYVKAKDLKLKQRVIGLNRKKHNERYLSVNISGGKRYQSESRFVVEYYFGDLDGYDVHHINGNFYDNRISNLEALRHHKHSALSNIGRRNNNNRCEMTGRWLKSKVPPKRKSKMPDQGKKGTNWYVISIEEAGIADVYDGSVCDTHNYIANGIVVHNCGEQPLLGYESCNLGSVNLSRMVRTGEIDWDRLEYIVKTAVRFLDNVIDMNRYPTTMIETRTKATRKIGLGVMGFADMLIKLDINYDTTEAVTTAKSVMKFIHDTAITASSELAETRGVFPAYRGSLWHTDHGVRVRNACLTTVAPTGTLSIIANCSSGIEPYYSKTIKKHILNTILEEEIECAKEDSFITAHDIGPEWHIKIQAAFQTYSDSAVSKTINFPNSATIDDIKHAYMLAYKLKCKGITAYRDGSRDVQVLNKDVCPNCGEEVEMSNGCKSCSSKECGWSACAVG